MISSHIGYIEESVESIRSFNNTLTRAAFIIFLTVRYTIKCETKLYLWQS